MKEAGLAYGLLRLSGRISRLLMWGWELRMVQLHFNSGFLFCWLDRLLGKGFRVKLLRKGYPKKKAKTSVF
jgi:hypothetical protein